MVFRNENKDRKLHGKKIPLILIVGQILLVLVTVRYGLNFCYLSFPEDMSILTIIWNSFFIIFDMGMAVLAANALVGLTSARMQSWRKVVRTAIILTVMSLFNEIISALGFAPNGVNYSPLFSVFLTVITLAIMFLPSVRRFYMPPMMDLPPIMSWIRYIVATPLVPAKEYRFSYSEGSQQIEDLLEPDTSFEA
jgi:hypothetical protein